MTDASSAELMVHFYTALARGEPDAGAQRAAKLELLRGRWAHPHHWAPYVLAGR